MFEMWVKGIAHENITVVPNNAGNNIGYDADRNERESFFLTYFIRKVATYVSDGKATLTLCFVYLQRKCTTCIFNAVFKKNTMQIKR